MTNRLEHISYEQSRPNKSLVKNINNLIRFTSLRLDRIRHEHARTEHGYLPQTLDWYLCVQ